MSKQAKMMIIPLYDEGVIFEILKHLPSKSLLRFRCVSKEWFRIIQSSFFVDCHRVCSHTRPGGIQLVSVMDCAFRSCILSDPQGNFQFCFDNSSLPDATGRISHAEALICFGNHIWNPSMRETMDIDIPQVQTCYSWDTLLGFDAHTAQYKVICFLNCRAPIVNRKNRAHLPLLQVFTLGENCWKQIPVIPDELCQGFDILSSRSFSNMIFCMIRCGRCGIKLRFDCIKFGVLTFDVQHEHVGFISIPAMFKFCEADLKLLADIEGCLAFQSSFEQTLWVLNHKIAQWTKMEITFPGCYPCSPWLGHVTDGIDDILAKFITIGTIQSDEILFQCNDYMKKSRLKYLYYDPVSKKIRFVPKLEKCIDAIWDSDCMMIKLVDSLVRLIPQTQKE